MQSRIEHITKILIDHRFDDYGCFAEDWSVPSEPVNEDWRDLHAAHVAQVIEQHLLRSGSLLP